jgi:ferredoxin, 2Fe-2S
MTTLIFVAHDGSRREVEAENGATLMEVAIKNAIPGIDAECGGACACATCHVYIEESALAGLPKAAPMEEDMLDFASDVRSTSRLSCQIKVSDALNGLVITTPARQG